MFSVVYKFSPKPDRVNDFILAWEELTKLIRNYEKSGGSRLHKLDDATFIAYAVWDSKDHWSGAGNGLPEVANKWRDQMRNSCYTIETQMELEVISDLLL